jgi:hypothetical protein
VLKKFAPAVYHKLRYAGLTVNITIGIGEFKLTQPGTLGKTFNVVVVV